MLYNKFEAHKKVYKMNQEVLVLNTGGTFNKIYDEISGELIVPKNNDAINSILNNAKISNIKVDGLIYKDSLNITNEDRKNLMLYIQKSRFNKIIIIHGTDTMNQTAIYLDKKIKEKKIVLTGAMKPFSIEPIEATSNLMSAFGFLHSCTKNNIYICMHSLIKKHTKIRKNKKLGIFECQ